MWECECEFFHMKKARNIPVYWLEKLRKTEKILKMRMIMKKLKNLSALFSHLLANYNIAQKNRHMGISMRVHVPFSILVQIFLVGLFHQILEEMRPKPSTYVYV
jgi:hypothetical protein